MHANEHAVTPALARHLITTQMPDLAHLPLSQSGQSGTDNVIFRLGPHLTARFPRLPHAAQQIAHLTRWLPTLTLPLKTPQITRHGQPDSNYAYPWTIGPWLPGQDSHAAPPDQTQAAHTLASFLQALQNHPVPPDAPSRQQSDRLDLRLAAAEHFIAQLTEYSDHAPLLALLAEARGLPPPTSQPVWVHGDLHPLNLLTRNGILTAVIDWGAMGAGDPATDLLPAWTLFDPPARAIFKAAMNPPPEAWARARAQAFAKAIMALPYYRHSNPAFHAVMKQTLDRVLWEVSRSGQGI